MATRARVGRLTLLRVLWRTFFYQATANYERMQNVGFGYCMAPALDALYEGPELEAALGRHLEFMNTHPYLANAIIGASVRLEEQVAAGTVPPTQVQVFKRCMMGPMAAIGDSFFWASLKPFAATWAIAGIVLGVPWAPLAFLGLYNLMHLTVRFYGLYAGYRLGEQVFETLSRLQLVRFADWCRYGTGLSLGVAGAAMADHASRSPLAIGDGLEPILIGGLTLILFLALKRQVQMPWLLYGFGLGTVGLLMWLNAMFPVL